MAPHSALSLPLSRLPQRWFRVAPVLHAVGGGVAFAPPASGWVRCSLRSPTLGGLVEVRLDIVGIALGPLAGVGQDCLGWGALLVARPFTSLSCCVLHCLLAACPACSFACCITLALSLSRSESAWQLRLASGTATPYKVVLLVHSVPAHCCTLTCHHALCVVSALPVGHILFAGSIAAVAQLLPALRAGVSCDSCQ